MKSHKWTLTQVFDMVTIVLQHNVEIILPFPATYSASLHICHLHLKRGIDTLFHFYKLLQSMFSRAKSCSF